MSASRAVQYPPPSGPYKVSLKNRLPWQGHAHVRLQVSVGAEVYEGAKLHALAEWAAMRFRSVDVIVSDTLQRFNRMPALGEAEAHRLTRAEGDAWLARNAQALTLLPGRRIRRWDDLLADAAYPAGRDLIGRTMAADAACKAALDDTVEAFRRRHLARHGSLPGDDASFRAASRAFLLEELGVFASLCREPGMDVYAGSWLSAIFTALRQTHRPELAAFERDWLQVDFTRNKGAVPATAAPQAQHGPRVAAV